MSRSAPELLAEARHPAIRACYDYWLDARARSGRVLPGRQHIDPLGMAEFLPYVVLIDVVREGVHCRFRFRLIGSHFTDVLGRDVTGRFIEHTGWFRIFDDLYRRYSTVVDDKVLAYGVAPAPGDNSAVLSFEHLTLPLAADGVTVDMLFGVRCALPFNAAPTLDRYAVAPLAE